MIDGQFRIFDGSQCSVSSVSEPSTLGPCGDNLCALMGYCVLRLSARPGKGPCIYQEPEAGHFTHATFSYSLDPHLLGFDEISTFIDCVGTVSHKLVMLKALQLKPEC